MNKEFTTKKYIRNSKHKRRTIITVDYNQKHRHVIIIGEKD